MDDGTPKRPDPKPGRRTDDRGPQERTQTIRSALLAALEEGPATARDLSGAVGIREKDVGAHLEHLSKSLWREGRRVAITPASCIACGFVFKDRTRFEKPGSCPQCRSTRIDPPVFTLNESGK